jgi:osmoprotectant transport system substrate-binding protein
MHKVIVVVFAIFLAVSLIIGGCAQAPGEKEVTVGNKNFTEQYVVGQLMKQLLEEHGYKVALVADLSTMALREGMESGDIDICAEYTGTAWMVHLGHEYTPGIDNNELYDMVKKEEQNNGFIWLDPIWNNNTYCGQA